MGPSHPAMHGTIRMVLKLDGETVQDVDVQPGYLHRGFEKMCERGTWAQVFPYTDRLNYVSPLLNNVGYALAVEKLLGITVPRKGQIYRVILGELARISDHLTCNGAMAMELGAFTPFLWLLKAREWIWEACEEQTGARITHSFFRIGGAAFPPTESFKARIRAILPRVLEVVAEGESLLLKNRIFLDRTQGVGILTKRAPSSLGASGPVLRRGHRLRRPQGQALPHLRRGRLRRARRRRRRHLRPLHVPLRRDAPERAHHRAVARLLEKIEPRARPTTR
jgi:NADH-quinone oxidoreductase subunit D